MKKKVVAPKKTAVKSVKRTAPKKSKTNQEQSVYVQRIVIVTAAVVIAAVGVVLLNKQQVNQSVAGISIARGLYAQAVVDIPQVDGAVSFNIYYKETSENSYNNAVRSIPVTAKSYTISYLKRGTEYDHRIVAVDERGSEFWFSPTRPLLGIEPM